MSWRKMPPICCLPGSSRTRVNSPSSGWLYSSYSVSIHIQSTPAMIRCLAPTCRDQVVLAPKDSAGCSTRSSNSSALRSLSIEESSLSESLLFANSRKRQRSSLLATRSTPVARSHMSVCSRRISVPLS